ncbi:hypothetical protein V7S43_009798 [Phytophthora oleae]|uniref:Uncharacterized protein n=1 Tax=Phytophthora oleae TaxID=2107226 RepID=A0ABD3FHZ3_9STRA
MPRYKILLPRAPATRTRCVPSKPDFGCIETWGYYGFLGRLEYCGDLFWFGGCPSKWSSEASNDGDFFADDLASLSSTDPHRYEFMIDHALLPDYIDEFGYTNVRFILEFGDALNPTAKPKSRLSLEALARIRRNITSTRVVSDQWVGDKNLDPWKRLCNNHDIKIRQALISKSLDDGTYGRPTTREITQAELDADDISDFEDDGEPTALAPVKFDEVTKGEDEGTSFHWINFPIRFMLRNPS